MIPDARSLKLERKCFEPVNLVFLLQIEINIGFELEKLTSPLKLCLHFSLDLNLAIYLTVSPLDLSSIPLAPSRLFP